jgi:phosphohistidine phosphatase SixA
MRWLIALIVVVVGFVSPASMQASDLLSQMRDDRGLVILMRHAIAPGGGDPAGFTLGDCSTQRQLSAQGRSQARAIGKQFRSQNVPIAGVRSSRWCRAVDTATLLGLGKVRTSSALDSVFTASDQVANRKKQQTEKIIRNHRDKSGVLILVGHQANIIDLTGIAPDSGGAVVVTADASGRIRVIGQLAPPDF